MLHSIPITGVSRKKKDQFTRRAVLFSVLFRRTLFSVKGSLKGKNGGKSSDGEGQFWIQALTKTKIKILKDFWEEFLVGILLKDKVSEKKMVELFRLATIPEIRDHITSITDRYGNSWEVSSHPNKVDLFLQAADGELQEKLEPLLEDKEEDEGLTTKWKNIEDEGGRIGAIFRKQYKHPKLQLEENTSINNSKNVSKQGYVQRCIWCDDASHTRKDCNEFNNMIRQGIICWKDGKIVLKDRDDILQTNFGKGGMRVLVQDYLKEHETAARESASYGARVDDEISGSTETSWEDPVESLSVHAYIAKSQYEALTEEKRRENFDDTREGNSSKRQTRGDKAREAASQELTVKDTSVSLEEKTKETKDKGKSIAYKLLSDIEAATNLKGVLEERILNAKMEFTLKEVLEIVKKEFYEVIIDSIKRKRQLMGETGMSHAIDARICRDEEEVDIGYKQPINEKNGYNQRVHFKDFSDKEMETLSHYTRKHWARATTEVLVKVGDIEEPIVALVDHGSEINLMSKDLYKKQKWPIDMEHGWAIRAANNTRGELYGACPDHRPTPVQILSGQVQLPRYSQPGHTEMLHSIPITGVSRKKKDQFTRRAVLFSVPFRRTLFSVKGSLKGKNGGKSSDGESQFWIQALTVGANSGSKTED
uniref:Predicted protein n=1 Tax=Physcomitrium patens TaxID=3218 RepID=A9TME8_PHYPA